MKSIRSLIIIKILLLAFFSAKSQQGSKDLLHVQYGQYKQNTLDLYLPASYSNKTAVIIMIHGGAWVMGGNEYTEKTSKDLRDRGFIVANIDYRYVSDSVHCADLLSDIDKAVACIEKKAPGYHFNNTGYHLAGISAGSHLALMYGYTTKKALRSISVLCPPTKLDDKSALAFIEKNNLKKNIELLANSQFETGKPPSKAFTLVSPYANITGIPTLIFHGDKDELVPLSQSTLLYDKLQQEKVKSKFIIMKGKGHDCGMNDKDSEKLVLDEITSWVETMNK